VTVLERFVVLEGLDGAGTTTQLQLLDRRLGLEGIPHFCTGEPTPGQIGRQIRAILRREAQVDPRTMALLFAADRNEHLHEPDNGILARLRRGELVISDRYLFSSLAYQSVECPYEYVREINRPFPLPQLVLFVDTPVVVSQERLGRRASGELFDAAVIQPRILELYHRAFAQFEGSGMELVRLDGTSSVEELSDKIWKILSPVPM
jgi:dTMP kinase